MFVAKIVIHEQFVIIIWELDFNNKIEISLQALVYFGFYRNFFHLKTWLNDNYNETWNPFIKFKTKKIYIKIGYIFLYINFI